MTKVNLASPSRWFVIQTNPTCEHRARAALNRAQFGVYVPMRRVEKFNSRKSEWVTRERSLLPGYLLVEMPPGPLDWFTLRRCDGVRNVLGIYNLDHDAVPYPIPSRLVERLMASQLNMEFDDTREAARRRGEVAKSIYQPGVAVMVKKGPFASFGAEIEMVRQNGTISALIEIFGRMTPVELDPTQIELMAA